MTITTSTRLLRIRQVLDRTGISRATLYRQIDQGNFPRSVTLGARIATWVESEVDAWIEAQIARRDAVEG